MTECACRWITYACFHPHTKASSWFSLILRDAEFGNDALQVMQDIKDDPKSALSITRLAARSGVVSSVEVQGDRLQLAAVKNGTVIFSKPDTQAEVFVEMECAAELEMCDLRSEDWVCVLVPGYSFGWVQRPAVVGTREWVFEVLVSSSLKELSLGPEFAYEDVQLLVSAIGDAIETLKLGADNSSETILDDLALRCPNLKALSIHAQEEPLSQVSLELFFSQTASALESLTIGWEGCNLPVLIDILTNWTEKEAVKRLKKLHLVTTCYHEFSSDEMALFKKLLQANQSLEQLYFSAADLSQGRNIRTPGAELETYNGEDIHRGQQTKQQLAFLSVVKRLSEHDRQCAFSRLDSAVIARVFDFGARHVRRLVYMMPSMDDDEAQNEGDDDWFEFV